MKPTRQVKPLNEKAAKVKELEGKKKGKETTLEVLERIEAKLDLLLSRTQ
jgi:hypothetical protein